MTPLSRRFIIFIIIFIGTFVILFSFFFANSRAGRITSDEEYIQSLEQASKGKSLAGQQQQVIVQEELMAESDTPNNIWEELLFRIKELFR